MLEIENSAVSVERAKELFKDQEVHRQLIYIKSHFKTLVEAIKKLETVGLCLTESLAILDSTKISLSSAGGEVAKLALLKLDSVLIKNPGYQYLNNIRKLLNGENSDIEIDGDWAIFKYAPVTSCDVERSFSWLHNVLNDKRSNYSPDNLEKFLVCHANNR